MLAANEGAIPLGKTLSLYYIKDTVNNSSLSDNLIERIVFQGWTVSEECSIIGVQEITITMTCSIIKCTSPDSTKIMEIHTAKTLMIAKETIN